MKKLLFLFAPLFILLFSCSQNLPELNAVSGTTVFEFESENENPVMKLSVFIDVTSDVHRAAGLRLECLQNDFKWECDNPLRFESGKKKYAGYTDFVMPGNKPFPAGKYILWYIDANGNEDSAVVNINYQRDFLTMTSKEAEDFCSKSEGVENWAVFDADSVLLYYSEKGESLTLEDLWNRYPKAETIRTVWSLNREIVLFPAAYKNGKPETVETEKEDSTVNESNSEPEVKEIKDIENEPGNIDREFTGETRGIDITQGSENLRAAGWSND